MSELSVTVMVLGGTDGIGLRVRQLLEREPRLDVLVTPDGDSFEHAIAAHPPDLVILARPGMSTAARALAHAVQLDPERRPAVVVLMDPTADDAAPVVSAGLVDDVVRLADADDCRRRLHMAARLALEAKVARVETAHRLELERVLRQRLDGVVTLLVHLLDRARPGATRRAHALGEMAARLAARFEVPEPLRFDLEMATRLVELGTLLPVGDPASTAACRRAIAVRHVLESIDGLAGTAELIGMHQENWDGTGGPDHLQRGQIPLRSRMLRVLVDLFALLEPPRSMSAENALERLDEHSGTHYDPMVVGHVRALITGDSAGALESDHRLLGVNDLAEGMVLAEDLYTDSGFKLLTRGTTLNTGTIATLIRRHKVEPLHAVAVKRLATPEGDAAA